MERGSDGGGIVADLAIGEADHAQTLFGEVGVAGTVVLEGLAATMGAPVVDFDDEPEVAPEEIDSMLPDLDVRLRLG